MSLKNSKRWLWFSMKKMRFCFLTSSNNNKMKYSLLALLLVTVSWVGHWHTLQNKCIIEWHLEINSGVFYAPNNSMGTSPVTSTVEVKPILNMSKKPQYNRMDWHGTLEHCISWSFLDTWKTKALEDKQPEEYLPETPYCKNLP